MDIHAGEHLDAWMQRLDQSLRQEIVKTNIVLRL